MAFHESFWLAAAAAAPVIGLAQIVTLGRLFARIEEEGDRPPRNAGDWFSIAGVVAALCSMVAGLIGLLEALDALRVGRDRDFLFQSSPLVTEEAVISTALALVIFVAFVNAGLEVRERFGANSGSR